MRLHGALSRQLDALFARRSWAGLIINMAGRDLRQAPQAFERCGIGDHRHATISPMAGASDDAEQSDQGEADHAEEQERNDDRCDHAGTASGDGAHFHPETER